MRQVSFVLMIVLAGLAGPPIMAQQAQGSGSGAGAGQGQGRGSQATTTVQTGPGRGGQDTVRIQTAQGRGLTRGAQATNVRLVISINDQSSEGQPIRKSITMLLADQSDGRVRSSGMVHLQVQAGPGPEGNQRTSRPLFEVELNVDAGVTLLADDRIRARITLEYTPGMSALVAGDALRPSPLNESVTVILQNGKPLVITQAADPVSDRKITVEVTGTILR